MAAAQKQINNLKLHLPHIEVIAKSGIAKRNDLLKNATPELVEALATACRLCDEQGVKFAKFHQRRARRMISKNTSKKTKKELVSGQAGKNSRGGGFFKDVGRTLLSILPSLLQKHSE